VDSSDPSGNFLERILGDLLSMMGTNAPGSPGNSAPLELARTLAQGVATGGTPERNVDPVERIAFEDLARIAELHVTEITGLAPTPPGTTLEILATTPGIWARQTLEDWRFLLDAATTPKTASPPKARAPKAGSFEPRSPESTPAAPAEDSPRPSDDNTLGTSESTGSEPDLSDLSQLGEQNLEALRNLGSSEPPAVDTLGSLSSLGGPVGLGGLLGVGDLGGLSSLGQDPGELFARLMATMAPMLAATQIGSAVGHLAHSTLGQYDLPVPRPASGRIMIIPANVQRFAEEWSLPLDQVRLWVCLRELTAHAILSQPPVAARLRDLLTAVVRGISEDTARIANQLETLDPGDPEVLQRLLGNPGALLGGSPPVARRQAGEELSAAVSVVLGYIEHVLEIAGTRLLGGRTTLAEAWRRRQVDREESDRATELLLGLDLSATQVERGLAFVTGVIERAGDEGLSSLWTSAGALPTPSELDAPGLWLERIRLDS
jgi:putative hydrolase